MSDAAISTVPTRKPWIRALLMLLFCAAFQLAASVLLAVAVLQLFFAAFTGGANERLAWFGRSLARYLAGISTFASFATEELPFPFSDWPAADRG